MDPMNKLIDNEINDEEENKIYSNEYVDNNDYKDDEIFDEEGIEDLEDE